MLLTDQAAQSAGHARYVLSLALAFALHASAALALGAMKGPERSPAPFVSQMIDVELVPRPPTTAPVTAPKPTLPSRSTTSKSVRAAPRAGRAPEPAEPARKDEVPSVAPASEPLDFTEAADGLYAGRSATALQSAGSSGVGARRTGAGSAGGASTHDASHGARGLSLLGSRDWRCPFPPEADADGIDEGLVTLRITVSVRGELQSALIVQESRPGFGRAAQRCAATRRYQPALDPAGKPVASSSVIAVRFVR